jgi:general secretion pathway protein A
MNKKLLSLYSLKFNPFSPEVPASALCSTPSIQSFCWRIEQQIGEGGFALAIGDPGTGKSAALRILVDKAGNLRVETTMLKPTEFKVYRSTRFRPFCRLAA